MAGHGHEHEHEHEPRVADVPERGRFEARVGEHVATAAYVREGDVLTFTHTEVPEPLQGRGVGSRLVREALRSARERGLVVVARCAFVAAYLRRHPDLAEAVRAGDGPSGGA